MPARQDATFWIGDRYCGLVKLGSGGMGEVWAGKLLGDHGFEQIVAIKRLNVDRRRFESDHRALLDEATILQHLSASPNIVTVIDLRVQDGQPALILEYIDGPELRDVLRFLAARDERLSFPLLAYITTEVSKGLSYAHQCRHPKSAELLGIIHRDVSPSNIMISSTGAVKLTDFGIAKSQIQTVETHVGEIKGKFAYMAPEQARGKKLDYRADYFALGLVLYECFYGRPAYRADSDAAFIEQARSAKIEYPSPAEGLEPIFKRLLAFEPSKRYADLDEFRRDIASAAIQLGGMATSEDLKRYLDDLKIPQLALAIERRKNLELAQVSTERVESEPTGTGTHAGGWLSGHWKLIVAASAAFVVAGLTTALLFRGNGAVPSSPPSPATLPTPPATPAATAPAVSASGVLKLTTNPSGAVITLINGKQRIAALKSPATFTGLPLGVPLSVTAALSDFAPTTMDVTLSSDEREMSKSLVLSKRPSITVRFTANPPSSVTVPGRLNHQDAPSPPLSMPAGSYKVLFTNPLASGPAATTLNAQEGGRYRCSADMQIDVTSGTPTGSPPTAACHKE